MRPIHTVWDYLAGLLFLAFIVPAGMCATLSWLSLSSLPPPLYVTMPIIIALILAYGRFRFRGVEAARRRYLLLLFLPLLLSLGLAGVPNASTLFSIAALLTLGLFIWYGFLRLPTSYRTALNQLQAGDLKQALDSATQAIKERPNLWERYQLRSLVNLHLGYFTNSERDARKAIELGPDFALPYSALGHALIVQGRLEEACELHNKAAKLAPGYTTLHYDLGFCYYHTGKYEKARQAFNLATKGRLPFLHQTLLLHYYLGKSLLALGQTEESKKVFTKMQQFQKGLEDLKQEITHRPHLLSLIQNDLNDLESCLK